MAWRQAASLRCWKCVQPEIESITMDDNKYNPKAMSSLHRLGYHRKIPKLKTRVRSESRSDSDASTCSNRSNRSKSGRKRKSVAIDAKGLKELINKALSKQVAKIRQGLPRNELAFVTLHRFISEVLEGLPSNVRFNQDLVEKITLAVESKNQCLR